MSDISVLSHEYHNTSEFSQRFNDALIVIKKFHKKLPGNEKIDPDELSATGRDIAVILLELGSKLGQTPKETKTEASKMAIPGSLVTQLRQEWKGELDYYLDDLKKTAEKLTNDISDLSDDELSLLDQVATVADAATSKVFRRLTQK